MSDTFLNTIFFEATVKKYLSLYIFHVICLICQTKKKMLVTWVKDWRKQVCHKCYCFSKNIQTKLFLTFCIVFKLFPNFMALYSAFRVKEATNERKHIKTDDYHLQTWKFRKRIKIQLNSVRNNKHILWMFYQSVCVESLTLYTCQNLSFSVCFFLTLLYNMKFGCPNMWCLYRYKRVQHPFLMILFLYLLWVAACGLCHTRELEIEYFPMDIYLYEKTSWNN